MIKSIDLINYEAQKFNQLPSSVIIGITQCLEEFESISILSNYCLLILFHVKHALKDLSKVITKLDSKEILHQNENGLGFAVPKAEESGQKYVSTIASHVIY